MSSCSSSEPPKRATRGLQSAPARLAICLVIAFNVWFCAPPAFAQQVVLPREGMQFLSVGLASNPAILHDRSPPRLDDSRAPHWVASGGASARFGLHQLMNSRFLMAAEAELGVQWLDEHSATTGPIADSGLHASWQFGVLARWLPFGERSGLAAGAGAHFHRLGLDEAPMQTLGADLRFGKYFWLDDDSFLLIEVGWAAPLIQGLTLAPDYDGSRGPVEMSWSFHRASLGFQVAL